MTREHTDTDRTQSITADKAGAPVEAPASARQDGSSLQAHYQAQSLAEIGRMYGGAPSQDHVAGPPAQDHAAGPQGPVQQSLAEIGRMYGGGMTALPAVAVASPNSAGTSPNSAGASPALDDATLAAAPAGRQHRKSGEDWGDPRESLKPQPQDFRGVALTRPAGEVQVPLGHRHRQAYWIGRADDAPAGTTFRWRHAIQGSVAAGDEVLSGETAEGASHELHVQPKVPGKKRIVSTAVQQGPGGKRSLEVDDVVLATPVPKMSAPVLDSIGKGGNRRPVLDTMALGEDLLVTVRFDLLDDDVDEIKPKLESSTLSYRSARKVGPGEFELRLYPAQPGKATGILRVPLMETSSGDMPPIKLEVNVEELRDQDDAGSRPRDIAGVRNQLEPVIEEIFKRRRDAVQNVYEQEKEKDPPPATPLWKTVLKTAVTAAINSVTAGLGAKIAGSLISDSNNKPFTTELVKMLFEQAMTLGAKTAVESAIEDGEGGRAQTSSKQGGAPRRSMGIMFSDAQKKALSAEAIVAKQRSLSAMENMVKRMEAAKPGSGFREALRLEAELEKSFELAETTQYIQTFQRWCAVLAANTLNTGKYDGPETNLDKSVDVDKVVRMPGEWGHTDRAIPGLSKTPGVLNLTLTDNTRMTAEMGGKVTHPVKVARATLSGLGSQDFRSTIKDTPIKELQLPIVASFSRSAKGTFTGENVGFVIGRNEAHRYWASEQGEYLSVLTAIRMDKAKVDPREAAEHIMTKEIGDETVEPKEP